jgi:hypothetical protein
MKYINSNKENKGTGGTFGFLNVSSQTNLRRQQHSGPAALKPFSSSGTSKRNKLEIWKLTGKQMGVKRNGN